MHAPFPETPRQADNFYLMCTVIGIPLCPGFMGPSEKRFYNKDFQIMCMIKRLKLTTMLMAGRWAQINTKRN
jgi:hypothetical protein